MTKRRDVWDAQTFIVKETEVLLEISFSVVFALVRKQVRKTNWT